jgi:hypothetical protein
MLTSLMIATVRFAVPPRALVPQTMGAFTLRSIVEQSAFGDARVQVVARYDFREEAWPRDKRGVKRVTIAGMPTTRCPGERRDLAIGIVLRVTPQDLPDDTRCHADPPRGRRVDLGAGRCGVAYSYKGELAAGYSTSHLVSFQRAGYLVIVRLGERGNDLPGARKLAEDAARDARAWFEEVLAAGGATRDLSAALRIGRAEAAMSQECRRDWP